MVAVAAASPALWFTVLHGQVSAIALAGFVGAWAGLYRRPSVAGGMAALGALALKPSLFVPAVALLLVARAWRVAAGAVLGALVVTIATLSGIGTAAVTQYAAFTVEVLRAPDRVASNLPLMHSLRTLWTGWLPGPLATGAYAFSAGAVVTWAALAWRRLARPLDRVARCRRRRRHGQSPSVRLRLVDPHAARHRLGRLPAGRAAAAMARSAYSGFLAPVWGVPLAALGVQVSTPVLVAWTALSPPWRRGGYRPFGRIVGRRHPRRLLTRPPIRR